MGEHIVDKTNNKKYKLDISLPIVHIECCVIALSIFVMCKQGKGENSD